MANRRFIDFPIASSVGDSDIILIWQSGANKQTTKATFLSGLPENLEDLNDVAISGLTNGQILRYDSVTGKWENTDQGNLDLNDLNDVSIVSPSNGQVLVYNSSTSRWENSSGGYVPYTGAVTTVNLGAQTIQAGSFVKAGGTAAQFLKANGSVDSNVYGTGTVTSVALTMPSAFSVANSPITTAGTLAVTGAGTVGQYIRGDGSLADFPESSGGGSSVSYYLNGSVAQGTIGGVAYKELNKVPVLGAGTDFTINADGYIASFITDAGDPNLLEIAAGNWNFETYFSASSNGGSPSFYVELYKVNSGGTATLIASNSTFPELIAFGTNVISYFSTLAVPTTALALTDRLAIRYYVIHSGRTIKLHTEDNHLCQIITTFTTGLTALNGLTAQIQNFAVGTSGTDFAIASATATHTFNLPTASATNRGALSSADWTTFNNKTSNLGTVTSVGLSSATSGVTIGSTPVTTSGTITLAIATASGSQNGLLSSTDWTTFNSKQNALTNPVTGTGTTNYLPKFTGASTIGNSIVQDNGSTITIGGSVNLTASTSFPTVGFLNRTSDSTLYIVSPTSGFAITDNSLNTIYNGTPTAHNWNISNALKMNLSSSGNLLIGGPPAADNGAKLQVSGTATVSGNVGIGTNTLGNRLVISQPVSTVFGNAGTYIGLGDTENSINQTVLIGFGYKGSSANEYPAVIGYLATNNGGEQSGALVFGTRDVITNTAPTERMRITSGGFLKLREATTSTTEVHILRADTLVDAVCQVTNGNASQTSDGLFTTVATRNTTNNTFYAYGYYNSGAGAFKFRIADSGNATNTNGSYGAFSDIKLKENITDASPKLSDLLKVKIRNYNLIGQDTKQIGVIAQELEEIFPGLIEESEDFKEVEITDENGNTKKQKQSLGTKTKSVKYSVFVPMLIKAMQEQQEQINELKNKLS